VGGGAETVTHVVVVDVVRGATVTVTTVIVFVTVTITCWNEAGQFLYWTTSSCAYGSDGAGKSQSGSNGKLGKEHDSCACEVYEAKYDAWDEKINLIWRERTQVFYTAH
jgi:hypothetical protein